MKGERIWMDEHCMFTYDGSLLLFLFFCRKPRTSPIRRRSNQTNTARSGGVSHFLWGILLSGCQQQLYLSLYLSWNNRAAGRTCPWRSLSVSRLNAFGSEWKGNTVHTAAAAQQYSFPSRCKMLPHTKLKESHPTTTAFWSRASDMTKIVIKTISR